MIVGANARYRCSCCGQPMERAAKRCGMCNTIERTRVDRRCPDCGGEMLAGSQLGLVCKVCKPAHRKNTPKRAQRTVGGVPAEQTWRRVANPPEHGKKG